ncbi:MAG: hypothetical protein ACI3XQ_11405 [Eubacteriales bacterium]
METESKAVIRDMLDQIIRVRQNEIRREERDPAALIMAYDNACAMLRHVMGNAESIEAAIWYHIEKEAIRREIIRISKNRGGGVGS